MGQVASLFRIDKLKLEEIEDKMEFDYESKEDIHVGKFWEPIMFIFGNGFLGREPFVNIFMPKNKINISETEDEWGPFIRFHDNKDISELNSKFTEISEEQLRERINLEKMNKTVMYKVYEEEIDSLIQFTKDVIKFFRNAELEGDLIIASIE